ncbi:MAG TPA: AAA family ATPase, partial [Novosphingobium sp.]|nr:AAA family ATPase [Novosphingobium sp.]
KGGVGKSSLAVNLADAAASAGHRTLLWDVDAQGAAGFLLGHGERGERGAKDRRAPLAKSIFSRDVDAADVIEVTDLPGLDLIAADLSLRHIDMALSEDKPKRLRKLLSALSPDYGRIVLDCPPGLGELSDQIFRAADILVVPVIPAPLALRTLDQVRAHLAQERGKKAPDLLPVFSMVDRRKALHREMVAAHPDWPVIPLASVIEQMGVKQAPLAHFGPRTAAAQAVSQVWQAVEQALAQGG